MSRYRKSMSELLNQVRGINKNEAVDDHEISMARGELEAIADKATQLASMLQGKSDEGNPLEAWVQSKITKAKDYITSVADYLTYNPDMKQNEELEEIDEMEDYGLKGTITDKQLQNIKSVWAKKTKKDVTPGVKTMLAKLDTPTKIAIKQANINVLSDLVEEINEGFSSTLKAKAKEIAKKLAGNMTKAYDEIEKIAKGLSKDPEVQKELQMANEEVEISEGQFKDIDIRKGDLKIARDKRQALKDKYNAIMANQAQGDEDSIQDQIRKLDMSIKKQEQDLIDKMKKLKDNEKTEAVDPEKVQKLNQKIASMTTKMGELDRSKPENKTKEAIMKSDIATAKLRLQDLMQKSASDVKKAVNEASKAKQSYKSLKMSLKKEQDINNKKKTLTDKPITKIDVNPKIEG